MKDAYIHILFKGHKPNFENKLKSRLINPSKTELGKVSKNIIQNIINVKKPPKKQNKLAIVIFGRNLRTPLNGLRKLKIKAKPHFLNLTLLTSIHR